MDAAPLTELHLHLYGCLRPVMVLNHLLENEAHFPFDSYEAQYERTFGGRPALRHILARARRNDHTAAAEFAKLFIVGDDDAGSFSRFQAKFDLLIAASALTRLPRAPAEERDQIEELVFREFEQFSRATFEDLARQQIAHAEVRMTLARTPETEYWPRTLDALRRGARRSKPSDPIVRFAPSLPRADPWPQWDVVSRLALAPGGECITGIDFCHVEEGHPPRDKREFFAAVRDHNERHPERALAVLYHVGESFTDKSLESAIRWVQEAAELGAHRLGHAIALGIDPVAFGTHTRSESVRERRDQIEYDLAHADGLERVGVRVDRGAMSLEARKLEHRSGNETVEHAYDVTRLDEVRRRQDYAMERVRSAGAVIEVCPTSNRRIGGILDARHHPVHRFLRANLRVAVASDDPGIFATTLAEELRWVEQAAGLEQDALRALRREAWQSRSEVLTGRVSAGG